VQIDVGVRTDVGRLRDHNEDSLLVRKPLFAVADGLGGHAGGEVASSLVIESLAAAVLADPATDRTLAEDVAEANRHVLERAREERRLSGMGTTLTAMLMGAGEAHVVHIGDSRLYLLRGGRLRQLTQDHSLREELRRREAITEDEVDSLPPPNILTRAIGIDEEIRVQDFMIEVRPGDRFLLCTDGLTTELTDVQIAAALSEVDDPQAVCDKMVDAANEAGGVDNVSVIVLDVM
jgi:PPM family protein phosphatase